MMLAVKRIVIVAALGLASAPAAAVTNNQWSDAGTAVTIGLMAGGYGLTYAHDDWAGAKSLTFSLAGAGLTAEGLKQVIHEQRPDGSSDDSFPSGHTTIAFASAGFIQKRYGWQVGLPATLAAAFVGFTRVQANKHFIQDVVAGAVIGEVWSFVLTKPISPNVVFIPWGDTKGGGVSLDARF